MFYYIIENYNNICKKEANIDLKKNHFIHLRKKGGRKKNAIINIKCLRNKSYPFKILQA